MSGKVFTANNVYCHTTTSGTGDLTGLTAVSDAYFTPDEAGVPNGARVRYRLREGDDVEIGYGTYTTGPANLTRDVVHQSVVGNVVGTSKIALAGNGQVSLIIAAEDMTPELMYRINADTAGANATGVQTMFPGIASGVPLVGGTIYEIEADIGLVKAAGATSHTVSLVFTASGGLTINNIWWNANVASDADGLAGANTSIFGTALTARVVTAAIATAAWNVYLRVNGTISVNAGGLLRPDYQLSAAPGGAYSTRAGSYFKFRPVGDAGADINIGGWA